MKASPLIHRIFTLAAERAGGESALVRHLGIPYSELRTYLAGEAMPPNEILVRVVGLVVDDLERLKAEFPEHEWRSLPFFAQFSL